MTHWRTVHKRLNKDLLFAEDLGGFGAKPVDVEIVESGVRDVSDGDSAKPMPWIAFEGIPKVLALNVTNCKILQTITGSGDVADWRGWITLIVVRTSYSDRKTKERLETDAIRIAPKRPAEPKRPSSRSKARLAGVPDAVIDAAIELLGRYRTCADPATFAALQVERAAIWKKLEPGPAKKDLADAAAECERRLAEVAPAEPPPAPPAADAPTADELAEIARLEREGA